MTEQVYDKAFDAWQVAQQSICEDWEKLTDPLNVQPDVPKAFRDAAELVMRAGGFLGPDAQNELRRRLSSVPTAKVARAVRAALNDGSTNEERIKLVREALNAAGIQVPPKPELLPEVSLEEIRLVAWMAVKQRSNA
jgi:hypothetical protein